MAEAKPVQPPADRAAMHAQAVNGGEVRDDLVQRQVAFGCDPVPQPGGTGGQPALGMIALALRCKTPTRALQDHHVVHKTRRNPKVPRGLAMPVPRFNKGDNPAA